MLSPQRLLVLEAVIASGSVHAAARNLNYSPATISQHLKALARETGLELFVRDGRGITPTAVAHRLAEDAHVVLSDLDRLDRTVSDLKKGPEEHLAIGCFSSVSQAWLPRVVEAVGHAFPRVTVEISLNEPHGGHGRRPADVDIRNEPVAPGAQTHIEGYRRHPLMVEEFLVVLPPGHQLEQESRVTIGDLRDEPWIDHDLYDSPTGAIVTAACTAAGFTPDLVARLDDHHAAVALVEAGLGVTVLPRLALTGLSPSLAVRPLTQPAVERRIVAHARNAPERHSLITTALDSLRDQVESAG